MIVRCVVLLLRFERLFRAAQTARMCTHLFRTIEEVEDLIAAYNDKVRSGIFQKPSIANGSSVERVG